MSKRSKRIRDFRDRYPHARGSARPLGGLPIQASDEPLRIPKGTGRGKRAVIIGAGVGGLTAAYELLKAGFEVTVLEARERIGGRCLTLRRGDTLQEDGFAEQTCTFVGQPYTTGEQYLNAGPGRIPSGHTNLLKYLQEFGVELEVYVMNSGANQVYVGEETIEETIEETMDLTMDLTIRSGIVGNAQTWRQLDNDTRGRLAALLYAVLDGTTEDAFADLFPDAPYPDTREQLQSLLIEFGALQPDGQYTGSDRSGFAKPPGITPGIPVEPHTLVDLLRSAFWSETSFYQPQEYLWQPTLFQPVGGMDKIPFAFFDQICALGGEVKVEAIVTSIAYDEEASTYQVEYLLGDDPHRQQLSADVCLSNMPIPLLDGILADSHLDPAFRCALAAIYQAQRAPEPQDRFLAPTTKVGWQAPRNLWQSSDPETNRSVPIFGGISWTDEDIVQIWYPSNDYHARLGVLTGAYNFSEAAAEWGALPPEQRLTRARAQAANVGGQKFAKGLDAGVAIAWQNIPYIRGGWAQWHVLDEDVNASAANPDDDNLEQPGETRSCRHYNALVRGSRNFFIVGDQLSELAGWQEGAVISALNAVRQICIPGFEAPRFLRLADTRITVEGLTLR